MIEPSFKCLFCGSSSAAFSRVEHPIPESLGNDDLSLAPGFVCDSCNQYFGSKVEQRAVNAPPFGVERVGAVVKTKKGKLAKLERPPQPSLYSTGYKDRFIFFAATEDIFGIRPKYFSYDDQSKNFILSFPSDRDDDFYTLRLLLKMGLELLLVNTDIDPYDSVFDPARRYARFAPTGIEWEIGYALYPRRDDLNISERVDEFGPLVTHQLYEYSIGRLLSGDVGFCFIYRQHIFACNLSSPSLKEYISGFNSINEMKMRRILVKR